MLTTRLRCSHGVPVGVRRRGVVSLELTFPTAVVGANVGRVDVGASTSVGWQRWCKLEAAAQQAARQQLVEELRQPGFAGRALDDVNAVIVEVPAPIPFACPPRS